MTRVVKCIKPTRGLEVGKLYEVVCDNYDLIYLGGEHDGHSRDRFEYVRAYRSQHNRDWSDDDKVLPDNPWFEWSELPTEMPKPHPLTKYTRKSNVGDVTGLRLGALAAVLNLELSGTGGSTESAWVLPNGDKVTVDKNGDVQVGDLTHTRMEGVKHDSVKSSVGVPFTMNKQIGGTHYTKNDPIQFARDNYPKEQLEGFFRINVDKYVARYDKKNGVEDLKKARHYLDMLIDLKD